ncbi:MAG: hypothetical protein ACYS29_03725 [Planctomycetota bacterium]|jgi:hypothetical protein
MGRKSKSRGRVLRVKQGYNPNSSSVGSQIPAFLAFAAGSGVFTVIAVNILNAFAKRIKKSRERPDSDNKR